MLSISDRKLDKNMRISSLLLTNEFALKMRASVEIVLKILDHESKFLGVLIVINSFLGEVVQM